MGQLAVGIEVAEPALQGEAPTGDCGDHRRQLAARQPGHDACTQALCCRTRPGEHDEAIHVRPCLHALRHRLDQCGGLAHARPAECEHSAVGPGARLDERALLVEQLE